MTITTIKHPPGLGSPLRISRPASDSYPTRRLNRRFVFVHHRNGFIASVMPSSFFSRFLALVMPGPGSEWASFGLARYPSSIEVTYSPRDDDRFIRTIKDGCSTRWKFDWDRWERWLKQHGHNRWNCPEDEVFQQKRKIKTGLSTGWHYSTFCKTQYASNPDCGGIPNFIRCHLSVIHLLDRIAIRWHSRERG